VAGRKLSEVRVRAVMDCLAAGMNLSQASRATGVSIGSCFTLHHSVGGVYRPARVEYSVRYLDRDQRYEIARLREAGWSMRGVARALGVAPATVSRELARNSDPATGRYQPERAHRLAWERQRRPKGSNLSKRPELLEAVQQLLDRRFSPEQIAGRLPLLFPDNHQMRVSHETIYQSIYVYPRGELKKELKASLRTGRAVRRRRGCREVRGKIPDIVSIHDRPQEVEGRVVPGHHEGDLVMGSRVSNSAVATLVERTTGYLNLLHLPDGHTSPAVCAAVSERMSALPPWFAKSLTWDRGTEMAKHKTITAQTNIAVYFADPYAPYQRASNENTNGLVREYLPKGTDLSAATADDLAWIEHELNDRPRKRLGFRTPKEAYEELLRQDLKGTVATTT
jgi:transposase, IS30 family